LCSYRSDGDATVDVGGAIQRIETNAVPEQREKLMHVTIRESNSMTLWNLQVRFSDGLVTTNEQLRRISKGGRNHELSAEGRVDEDGLLVLFRHKDTLYASAKSMSKFSRAEVLKK